MPLPRPRIAHLGLSGLVGLLFALAPAQTAQAQAFADFTSLSQTFAGTNTGSSFSLTNTAQPVSFSYDPANATIYNQIATNFPTLTGAQSAEILYSGNTVQEATANGGTLTQLFNGPVTIQFLLNTPFNGLSNLLTATISLNAEIVGPAGAQSSSFLSANPSTTLPATITYTSDFFNAGSPLSEGVSVAFSGLSSSLSMGSDGFLSSFTSSQVGNFSAYYGPLTAVPLPGSLLMLSSGLFGLPAVRRRLLASKTTTTTSA